MKYTEEEDLKLQIKISKELEESFRSKRMALSKGFLDRFFHRVGAANRAQKEVQELTEKLNKLRA
jgi:hypothetical protein